MEPSVGRVRKMGNEPTTIPVIVMGLTIGEANGWDAMDWLEVYYHGFKPHQGTNLEARDLGVDYRAGEFLYFNNEGEIINRLDIKQVLGKDLNPSNDHPHIGRELEHEQEAHQG